MAHFVCPWWLGYFLTSPLRRRLYDPRTILTPFLREGMIVFEPGPGMGFFTIEIARMIGPKGKVIAVDIQPKMLEALERKAGRAGLADRIAARLALPDRMGIDEYNGRVDFVLAFAMVHELPNAGEFFREAFQALAPGGKMLFSEPVHHVSVKKFEESIKFAEELGFKTLSRPAIRSNLSAVLEK
jgi:SAM-dependent methyltransferase